MRLGAAPTLVTSSVSIRPARPASTKQPMIGRATRLARSWAMTGGDSGMGRCTTMATDGVHGG